MRAYGLSGFIIVLLISTGALFAVLNDQWGAALVCIFVAILVSFASLLIGARYQVRLMRSESRKIRLKLEEALEQNAEVLDLIHTEQRANFERIEKSFATQLERMEDLYSKLSGSVKAHRGAITAAVRNSTTETESQLQIYARFSETKLPMPLSGGWAIDAQSLAYLISYVQQTRPRRILELGSGTSTSWLGYIAKSFGGQVITLDHLPHYLEQTRISIAYHGLGDWVESRYAPLEEIHCDGQIYSWYSRDAIAGLSGIDMLLVDGPPAATGPLARYPALPELVGSLSPDATVILDDFQRKDESAIVDSWLSNFPEFTEVHLGASRIGLLKRRKENG